MPILEYFFIKLMIRSYDKVTKKIDSDEIYKLLKRRIIELEYRPGEVLNEIDVADEFEISRTLIRKVFQQLSDDKLLNIILDLVHK